MDIEHRTQEQSEGIGGRQFMRLPVHDRGRSVLLHHDHGAASFVEDEVFFLGQEVALHL